MNNSIRNKAPPNFLNLENKNKIEVIFKIITMNNLNKMRTKEFEVPNDFIVEFAEALAEHELTNEINGVTEQGEILIEVSYEKDERAAVFALTDLLDDYYEDEEESEDEYD